MEIAIVITGSLPYLLLIIGIVKGEVRQSFASWLLWLILDTIVLYGIMAQKGSMLLFSVFTTGTLVVTLFLVFKKQFSWEKFETFVSVLVGICIFMLLRGSPYISIIASTAALNIAGIPQIIGTYRDPRSTSTKAYFLFMLASLLSVISTEVWTVQDKLPQTSSTVYCFIIVLLSMRKAP